MGGGRSFETDDDPQFGEVVRKLKSLKKDLLPTKKQHNCSHSVCNPQSESQLLQQTNFGGVANAKVGGGSVANFGGSIANANFGGGSNTNFASVANNNIISNNIFICKYGSIHVCNATMCENYSHNANQTCHISGMQLGTIVASYDKNDHRTWRKDNTLAETTTRVPVKNGVVNKRKAKKTKILDDETLLKRADNIITQLLYSDSR